MKIDDHAAVTFTLEAGGKRIKVAGKIVAIEDFAVAAASSVFDSQPDDVAPVRSGEPAVPPGMDTDDHPLSGVDLDLDGAEPDDFSGDVDASDVDLPASEYETNDAAPAGATAAIGVGTMIVRAVGDGTTEISWTTNVPAHSKLLWGFSPDKLDQTYPSAEFSTLHRAVLRGDDGTRSIYIQAYASATAPDGPGAFNTLQVIKL